MYFTDKDRYLLNLWKSGYNEIDIVKITGRKRQNINRSLWRICKNVLKETKL